jgi:hypothetical protein
MKIVKELLVAVSRGAWQPVFRSRASSYSPFGLLVVFSFSHTCHFRHVELRWDELMVPTTLLGPAAKVIMRHDLTAARG